MHFLALIMELIYLITYAENIDCFLEFFPPLWFLCITSFNHWLLIVNASCNFFIYCSVGKNFKDTIKKFIERTPLRNCLKRNNSSSPQINGDGVDEEMPMKGNHKKGTTSTTNYDQSRSASICPNSTMVTTTAFTNQCTTTNIQEDDKTKIVVELNNDDNRNGNDGVCEDVKVNGVGILFELT